MSDRGERPWGVGATIWLVAAWMVLTVAMAYIAGANFGLLKPGSLPRAEEAFGPVAHEQQGTLGLRYLASELNRTFFTVYGWGQLLLGAGAVVSLVVSGRRSRVLIALVGLSFVTALVFQFHLVPEIVETGRSLDLVPKEPVTPAREAFDGLHRFSVRLEVTKLALLAVASALLVFRRSPAD